MNIVTFYSYKGGTGRSLCLANVAVALNRFLGQRVGMIDLDFEAAGLHHIFNVSVKPDFDLLNFLIPKNRDKIQIEKYVHKLPITEGLNPSLFMIPTISDPSLLDQVPLDKGVESFLKYDLFPDMKKLYNLDYLLIDARSGLSNYSAYALGVADLNILVCRPDLQNRYGISKMIGVCHAAGKPYMLAISACPQPKKNQGRLASFFKDVGEDTEFIFPYNQDLYFEEFIATLKEPSKPLARSYIALAEYIHNTFTGE